MHHFTYQRGRLHAEDVAIDAIAEAVGTPFYCYSTATLERHYRAFAGAVARAAPKGRPAHVFFAMKSNSNQAVIATLARLGAGADTVSEGEVRRALAAGIPASKIVFSGVGKTDAELGFAVDRGLYQINVETEGELHALSRIAAAKGRRQDAVIRVNPDVGAGGHAKITTGSAANKFGVSLGEAERLYQTAANLAGVRMLGLAVHIGSQIRELGDLEAAFKRLAEIVGRLRAQGMGVERLDLGGGLGIPYDMAEAVDHGPDLIEAYARMVADTVGALDVELGFEPGRLIVGNAGILVTRVLHLNPRPEKQFVVVDAAMNDLIRPAMYDAFHDIWPIVDAGPSTPRRAYDVVGPICESGDTFCVDRMLPVTKPGDLIAFMTAGAYGATMSSTYNSRLLVPEVLVKSGQFAVVRPRPTYDDLIALDRVPDWIK
jgi:diaminopimelate decarboxylase